MVNEDRGLKLKILMGRKKPESEIGEPPDTNGDGKRGGNVESRIRELSEKVAALAEDNPELNEVKTELDSICAEMTGKPETDYQEKMPGMMGPSPAKETDDYLDEL